MHLKNVVQMFEISTTSKSRKDYRAETSMAQSKMHKNSTKSRTLWKVSKRKATIPSSIPWKRRSMPWQNDWARFGWKRSAQTRCSCLTLRTLLKKHHWKNTNFKEKICNCAQGIGERSEQLDFKEVMRELRRVRETAVIWISDELWEASYSLPQFLR